MASKDPSGYKSLTSAEKAAVRNLASKTAPWEEISTFHKTILLSRALKTGALPDSQARLERRRIFEAIGGFVLITLLVVWGVKSCSPATPEEKAALAAEKSVKTCNDASMAWIQAKDFVTDRLKAPKTAEFPSRSSGSVSAYKNCEFEVYGYVDSQNSFGAMIRSHYNVNLRYDMNTNRWVPIKVRIE